jgi:pimeloyl-ACP methyl ester carboxylesterase
MTPTDELVTVDGIALHVSVRGTGSPVLLVPGAGGDGGQYDELARRAAETHTVVTYDRRANSRSPRPDGYAGTSIEEQAADAAALLDALGLAPAVVFGNSLGAVIALGCGLRSPSHVTRLVLHEPALIGVVEDPDAAMAAVQPVIATGMSSGGVRGGADAFFRFADDAAFSTLPEPTRDRMLDNGQVLFESEFGAFASWQPDPIALAMLRVPVTVLVGRDSPSPAFREAATWLARHTRTQPIEAPGGHLGFIAHPDTFAAVLDDESGR